MNRPLDTRSTIRWFLIAQVWAFFLAMPELVLICTQSNRYFLHWNTETAMIRIAAIGLAGLLIFGLGLLIRFLSIRQARSIGALSGILSIAWLGWMATDKMQQKLPDLMLLQPPALLFITAGGCLICWRRKWNLQCWSNWLGTAALVFSPTIPLFWINCLNQPHFGAVSRIEDKDIRHVTRIRFTENRPTDNVYIFVFDGWSHRLTIDRGQVADAMPNLRQLSRRMCIFTDSHSAGCHTFVSMPRLLFQTTDRFAIRGGELGVYGDAFRPVELSDSMFRVARRWGYETFMIGWYHPYERLLFDQADKVRSVSYYEPLGNSLADKLRTVYWTWSSRLLGDRLTSGTLLDSRVFRNYALVQQTADLLESTYEVLEDRQTGQFAVFHLPVPHWPFCHDCEGPKELNVAYRLDSDKLARDQLAYVDQLIAEFVSILEETGKLDTSTIVMTSDHNWRNDPELTQPCSESVSRVPLLVMFPGQQEPVSIADPFSCTQLLRLIKRRDELGKHPTRLADMMADGTYYEPLADDEVLLTAPLVIDR